MTPYSFKIYFYITPKSAWKIPKHSLFLKKNSPEIVKVRYRIQLTRYNFI